MFGNIVDRQAWWPPVTWFVQIMPLFFIAGGYAAAASWKRTAATGGTPFTFVRARVQRLVPTALVMIGLLGSYSSAHGSLGCRRTCWPRAGGGLPDRCGSWACTW